MYTPTKSRGLVVCTGLPHSEGSKGVDPGEDREPDLKTVPAGGTVYGLTEGESFEVKGRGRDPSDGTGVDRLVGEVRQRRRRKTETQEPSRS